MTRKLKGEKLILLLLICCFVLFGCADAPVTPTLAPLVELKCGGELYIQVSGSWESDDSAVVTVTDTGTGYIKLFGVSEGVATVRNTADTNDDMKEFRVSVKGESMYEFEIAGEDTLYIDLSENEYYRVQLSGIAPESLQDQFDFRIEDTRYAGVSEDGLIRGCRNGVTKLFVTHKESGAVRTANIVVGGSRSQKYKKSMDTGGTGTSNHVQGFAADPYGDYFYYSFTDRLIKQSADGEVLGSVTGFGGNGHLGDVTFNETDGKIYVSFVADIAYGLPSETASTSKNCYILIFDADKITAMDMNASGIVTAVYVGTPVVELASQSGNGPHGDINQLGGKYGVINAIDSLTFGPKFGEPDGKQYLTLGLGTVANSAEQDGVHAYMRSDNDYLVLAQFDVTEWSAYAVPFDDIETAEGPQSFDETYLYYFGCHDYGIQNLMYDEYTEAYFISAYGLTNNPGDVQFPNYMLYVLDAAKPAVEETLAGNGEEKGLVVTEKCGLLHEESGVRGYTPSYSVGMCAMGDGYYYIATSYEYAKNDMGARIDLYAWALTETNQATAVTPIVPVQ